MHKLLVQLTAAIFFLYGLAFLLFPNEALYAVVQSSVSSSSAITDIRATYGGMSLGVGLILYLLSSNPVTIKAGLWSVAFVLGGMALGRGVGIVVDGNANTTMYVYLALEIAAASVATLFSFGNRPSV